MKEINPLQLIDCNCNDCKHMVRDSEKRKASLDLHREWQLQEFETRKRKEIAHWRILLRSPEHMEQADVMLSKAEKMRFQFDSEECAIHYGHCQKFDRPVSFIPITCQIETQECFEHRKS
jgi:hypothetical protein